MDELITKFEEQIVKDIRESQLPMQVVRLVLIEVQNSVVAECQRAKEQKEKESETNGSSTDN